MTDQRSLDALDVTERHANGQADDEELSAAGEAAKETTWDIEAAAFAARVDAFDAGTTTWVTWKAAFDEGAEGAAGDVARKAARAARAARAAQAVKFREIVEGV